MSPEELPEQDEMDWEEWPTRRCELVESVAGMREQFRSIEMNRPGLEPLQQAVQKFMSDVENLIAAGDAEYRRRHPGARFDPS